MARRALAGQGGGVDNGVFSSFPAAARFDSAVMARLGPLEVLRYNFLPTFSGVASVGIGRNSSAEVKDDYELQFPWSRYQTELESNSAKSIESRQR